MKKHLGLLKPLFYVAILLFFALFLKGIDYDSLSGLSINWPLMLLATLISLSFRYWGVFIWRTILSDLGAKKLPHFSLLSSVYSKAWMGRYIPGSVTWIAGKIYLASSIGISKSRLTIASLLEAAVQIAAITFTSLLIIGFDPRTKVIPIGLKILLVVGALCLLIALHPRVFNKVMSLIYKVVKKKETPEQLKVNGLSVTRSFILYAIGSIISGCAYYFMAHSIYPSEITASLFFYMVGSFNLSGVIGMATPFVPSGIGIRDGVQLVLLSAIVPKEIALVLTVFSRLWSALVDILFYLISQVVYKLMSKQQDSIKPKT